MIFPPAALGWSLCRQVSSSLWGGATLWRWRQWTMGLNLTNGKGLYLWLFERFHTDYQTHLSSPSPPLNIPSSTILSSFCHFWGLAVFVFQKCVMNYSCSIGNWQEANLREEIELWDWRGKKISRISYAVLFFTLILDLFLFFHFCTSRYRFHIN